jgi:hypothetical protein
MDPEEVEYINLATIAALDAHIIALQAEIAALDGVIATRAEAPGGWLLARRAVALGALSRIRVERADLLNDYLGRED